MAAATAMTILMPAYNEGRRIGENIRAVYKMAQGLKKTFEIIVIDDGSGDWTLEEAGRAAAKLKGVSVKRNPVNQGKGWALKEGFRDAKGEWIVFLDSDLDLEPEQVKLFFDIQKSSGADVVIGSKRHPDSKLDYPAHRKVISNTYFYLIKALFGMPIRDTQTGLKIFSRKVLYHVFPKVLVKRYAFDLELLVLAHHSGYTIVEAPVIVKFRGKMGHIGPMTIFNVFWDTMAVFYRLRIKRTYDRLG